MTLETDYLINAKYNYLYVFSALLNCSIVYNTKFFLLEGGRRNNLLKTSCGVGFPHTKNPKFPV